jgi:uncharacterized protein (TIGR00725 family)
VPAHSSRRPVVAVIGNAEATAEALRIAEELGRRVVEHGWRLITGGLGGVMEAASRGAHQAAGYREGDVVGILPVIDPSLANPFVDIVIPTGMGHARNLLVVATADAVVAIGGGAGTLAEMAFAWQLGRPLVGLLVEGHSLRFAGQALDEKRSDAVWPAPDAARAVARLAELLTGSPSDE